MSTSLRPGLAHSQIRADGARMHPRSRGSGAGRLAARQTGGWLGPARARAVCRRCVRSGPCLLHVPVLCVLGLCAFVLVVWCACIAFVYLVRPSPVNVTVLCARAVRATVLCVLGLCAQPRRDVTCHIAPCW